MVYTTNMNATSAETLSVEKNVSVQQPPATKKNRRQRAAAAAKVKIQAVQPPGTEAASGNIRDSTPCIAENEPSSADNKPKGWQASLTIADIKAMRAEEARKECEAARRAKQESKFVPETTHACQIGKDKGRKSCADKGCQTSPGPQAGNNGIPQEHNDQPQQRAQHIHNEDHTIQFMHPGRFVPSCGIRGCPVKAFHSRRAYKFNESGRPYFIKMIQDRAAKGIATNKEFKKLDRFFNLHRHV